MGRTYRRGGIGRRPAHDRGVNKILVVDDDPMIVAIYKRAFLKAGFEVDAAADGREGLDRFHAWKPDVVLLDMNLPGVSGCDFLKLIRHEPGARAKVPIVVLTGGNNRSNVMSAFGAGANSVMVKQRDQPQQVVDVIKTMLSGDVRWG